MADLVLNYLYLYAMVALVSMGTVSLLMNTRFGAFTLGRVFGGGIAGYGSSRILVSSTTVSSYVGGLADGTMGIMGYILLLMMFLTMIVWGWNLFQSDFKEVVR